MNFYGFDNSLLELDFTDQTFLDSFSSSPAMIMGRKHREKEEKDLIKLSTSILKSIKRNDSPPKYRHDGTSPLPLGMDWSPPPRNWDGRNTIWPHDFRTGWSYCVTVPSWSILSESGGSKPVAFYRVQVGLQSPEGVTVMRGVLKRFSDFLRLSSDLQRSFCKKKFPPLPPKGLLRSKSKALLEERRFSLEDWMEKILSDIEISRSAPIACFLELEAAARSLFSESSDNVASENLTGNSGISSDILSSHSDGSTIAETSASASKSGVCYSEIGKDGPFSENNLVSLTIAMMNAGDCENEKCALPKEDMDGNEEKYLHERNNIDENCSISGCESSKLSIIHHEGSTSSQRPDNVDTSEVIDTHSIPIFQFSPDMRILLPTNERQKMNGVLSNMQQRLATSKNDVEDLISRLNQELAVRQYLDTRVKDMETELEFTKNSGRENMQQVILYEKEKCTHMQWDMEELRRKYMEMEFSLKAEKGEKADLEAIKTSLTQENELLHKELDCLREQLKNLQKCHDEADVKSKSDVKLLVREVKSLRSSQSELKQELDRLVKERTESMMRLQKERQMRENANAANIKLVHECEMLRGQLEECSIDFLIEEENKIQLDAPSPSDALDILDTSESRIGLLLAEAQLIAQDTEIAVATLSHESEDVTPMDDQLRKMLTDVLVDNIVLRKQVNSIIRTTLKMTDGSSIHYASSEKYCS